MFEGLTGTAETVIPVLRAHHFSGGARSKPWHSRRECTALGLEACLYLWDLLQSKPGANILEVGAGLSSTIFRHWQREYSPGSVVVTLDTSGMWLDRTAQELKRDGYQRNHMYVWDKKPESLVNRMRALQFDIVLLDHEEAKERAEAVPVIIPYLARDGVIVVDDWHMPHVADSCAAAFDLVGCGHHPEIETLDEFGRFVATATLR